jgi:hypothetical protein
VLDVSFYILVRDEMTCLNHCVNRARLRKRPSGRHVDGTRTTAAITATTPTATTAIATNTNATVATNADAAAAADISAR